MTIFHVNNATGDIGVCKAVKGKCPFGGQSGDENHYNSIVVAAQAYEDSMKSNLIPTVNKNEVQDAVHWNPRTNSPANCGTKGCAIGAQHHYANWDTAIRAQEAEWADLADNGVLKGKSLTTAIKWIALNSPLRPKIFDIALTKGNKKQIEGVIHRFGSEMHTRARQVEYEGKKFDWTSVTYDEQHIDAIRVALAKKVFYSEGAAFANGLPAYPHNRRLLTDRNLMTNDEADKLIAYNSYWLFNSVDKDGAREHSVNLLKLVDRKVSENVYSVEELQEVSSQLGLSQSHVFFGQGRYRDPRGPDADLYEDIARRVHKIAWDAKNAEQGEK